MNGQELGSTTAGSSEISRYNLNIKTLVFI